jgi:hypothetical protein
VTQVGTMTFTFTDANTGTMSYSINGSNGTKPITKSVFASPPTNGNPGGSTGGPYGSLTVTGSTGLGTFSPGNSDFHVEGDGSFNFFWSDPKGMPLLGVDINSGSDHPSVFAMFYIGNGDVNIAACGASLGLFGDCSGVTIDHNTRAVTFSNFKMQGTNQAPAIILNGKLLY